MVTCTVGPEKSLFKGGKINETPESLVERQVEFKIYALSVHGYIGSHIRTRCSSHAQRRSSCLTMYHCLVLVLTYPQLFCVHGLLLAWALTSTAFTYKPRWPVSERPLGQVPRQRALAKNSWPEIVIVPRFKLSQLNGTTAI